MNDGNRGNASRRQGLRHRQSASPTGDDELIPLEITDRRLRGEPALRIWREYRKLTQEQLAKKSKVSRALIAAIETNRKSGSATTWKKLAAALNVSWDQLA
jgi:DNA-binding XRE family transcriptional regulator